MLKLTLPENASGKEENKVGKTTSVFMGLFLRQWIFLLAHPRTSCAGKTKEENS